MLWSQARAPGTDAGVAPLSTANAMSPRLLPSPLEVERGLKSQSEIDAVHALISRRVGVLQSMTRVTCFWLEICATKSTSTPTGTLHGH